MSLQSSNQSVCGTNDVQPVALFTAPGPPVDVQVVVVNSTSLKVTWKAPSDPNGIIVAYKVFYTFTVNDLGEDVNKETKVKEFTGNATLEFVMDNLGMDTFHI